MKTDLTIPLLRRRLGVTEMNKDVALKVDRALTEDRRLTMIIGALINIHKKDFHDTREVREKFDGLRVEVGESFGDFLLICRGVPADCLYDGKNVIWESVEQISSTIRDVVFPPPEPENGADPAQRSAYLRKFVEHSGLLYRGERQLVTFTWGGHKVSRAEYEFAKQVGYWTALSMPAMENITGCGDGIMKAPFKGAQVGYGKQRTYERFGMRDFIGFTEKDILAAEAPNELVNRLVVFPNIEYRMEGFIRSAHRGRVHPGGVGTLEEILTMLAVRSMPENRDIPFEFDMVEREEGTYFLELDQYLGLCFKDALAGLYTVHRGSPSRYARHVHETSSHLPMRYLWNDDWRFAPEVQHPFEVTFQSMEGLDLSRNQSPYELMAQLRRFFSAVVHLTVKDPDMLDSWGDDRPLIHGDTDILRATEAVYSRLCAQGRIHTPLSRKPFRIE